jgi:hypothetical protein
MPHQGEALRGLGDPSLGNLPGHAEREEDR